MYSACRPCNQLSKWQAWELLCPYRNQLSNQQSSNSHGQWQHTWYCCYRFDAKTPRPRTPMAKELLQRQIDATDRQIDGLGY